MALTRITQGVIKPNENYDTHNINSTGIITATAANISGNMSVGGILTYEDVTNVDSVGLITARSGIRFGGHILPTVNESYDIGSADYKVRHLFLSDNSLKFVDSSDTEHPLSVDSGRLKFAGGMLLGNNIKMDTTSGIVTASAFKLSDGSNVGGVESDSMLNTVAGTLSGDSIINSGVSGTSGTSNTLFGYSAGRYIALGDGNTCFGGTAGRNIGGGSWNTFIGGQAGRLMDTSNNTCIGYYAGETNNAQGNSVALGYEAARNASNAARFTALGYRAGKAHTGGNGNTYVGYEAGYLNTNGDRNVILGDQGVHNSSDFNRVTVIGASAGGGFGSNANDNTVIGYNAGGSTLTGTNNIIIGSGANLSGNVSNEITLGDSNITKFRIPGIGVTFATSGNHISGITTFANGRVTFKDDIIQHNGYHWYGFHGSNLMIDINAGHWGLKASGSMEAFISANSSGGTAGKVYLSAGSSGGRVFVNGPGGVELHHSGASNKKFETTSSGITVSGSVTDDKGDVRKIIINNQTSSYTLVASDMGKAVHISTGGVTVPNAVFSAGDAITIINNSGSDQTITQGTNVTMYNTVDATTGNRTLAGRGMATIYFVGSSTAYISGAGLS